MGSYSLNWPGFGDFPIYVIDKDNGVVYSDRDPLPFEKRNLNHFGHRHVLLDDVMELFSSMTMVKASIKLVLMTDNVTMYPIYKDERTKRRYLSLDTLLAFIIVFPFCPEFQRARAAILRFLTLYTDLTCMACGFIQRDCRCSTLQKRKTKPLSHPSDDFPEEVIAKLTDLTETSTQTDPLTCPICENLESFKNATSPWLVMPPGMKVKPGDKIPLPALNNAKIINCAALDTHHEPKTELPQSANIIPQQCANNIISQQSAWPDFTVMQGLANMNNMNMPLHMLQPTHMGAMSMSMNNLKPMMPFNMQDLPLLPGQSNLHLFPQLSQSPLLSNSQPNFMPQTPLMNVQNMSFPGVGVTNPYWQPGNNNPPYTNPTPGSMGPPPYPLPFTTSTQQLPTIRALKNNKKAFKPNKIPLLLSKRKQSTEPAKLGRPPKKKKMSSDFKMIGPAPVKGKEKGKEIIKLSPEAKKILDSEAKELWELPLEPGEVPKDVLEKIKDNVIITTLRGKDSSISSSPVQSISPAADPADSVAKESDTENQNAEETQQDSPMDLSADQGDAKLDTSASTNKTTDKSQTEKDIKDKVSHSKEGSPAKDTENTDTANKSQVAKVKTEESQSEESKDSNNDEAKTEDDLANKEKPLKITSVSGVLIPADKCKDSPYYMVSPQSQGESANPNPQGFAEFEFGPTGEKMLRCILYGCGQCFDTHDFAELHEKTHCARGQGLECPDCDSFKVVNTRWYHLLRHMEKVHDCKLSNAELQCSFCGLTLDNEEEFKEHQSFHYYSHYKCIHCGVICFTWNHVKHHLKDCPDKEKGHFYHNCPYCHIVFHGPSFLEVHIKSHQDQGLVCCYCKEEKVWDSWKHLKKHYEIFHLAKEHKRLHKCMHCKMHFSSLKKFKAHMETRHNPENLEEPKVPKKRKRKTSKMEKEKNNGGEEEVVKERKKEVVGKKSGRIRKKKSIDTSEWIEGDEVLSDEEENPEDAADTTAEGDDDKDKSVTEDADKKEDDGDKKQEEEVEEDKEDIVMLDCPECGKQFRTKKRLDLHLERTHGEEVQCPSCDYVARNAYYLRAHEQQKHGQKQHQCSECGKPFSTYFELKSHLAKHARKTIFVCKICLEEYGSRKALKEHKALAHTLTTATTAIQEEAKDGEQSQLTCPLCDYTCASRTELQNHNGLKHPEASDISEGVDHAYFNKSPVVTKAPKRMGPGRGRGRKMGRGGRGSRGGRGRVGVSRGGRPPAAAAAAAVGGRRKDKIKEKKWKDKLVKDKMIRKLKRSSCARTRSIDDHRAIKNQESEQNVTIDETVLSQTPSRPAKGPGRARRAWQMHTQTSSSSLWENTLWSMSDVTVVRSVELDHSYYSCNTQEVVQIRNQAQDRRDSCLSLTEDDAWVPSMEQNLSPNDSRSVQTFPHQYHTVLGEGPGQLQDLHGSRRVERLQSTDSTQSIQSHTEENDTTMSSQNDSLGDLENLIQGDMSDIMLAAEQYLHDSSLMNDSIDVMGSPNTSTDLLLQDSLMDLANVSDPPLATLPASPTRTSIRVTSANSHTLRGVKLTKSPRRVFTSPKKKVIIQAANRQPFILPKFSTGTTVTSTGQSASTVSNSVILTSSTVDYVNNQSVLGEFPETETSLEESLDVSSENPEDISQNDLSSMDSDNIQHIVLRSPEPDSENTSVILQSPTTSSSPRTVFLSPSVSKSGLTTVIMSTASSTSTSTPKTIVLPSTGNKKQTLFLQSPVCDSAVFLPTSGDKKKIMIQAKNAVGNMRSVFQDTKVVPAGTHEGKVKVIRIVQSPVGLTNSANHAILPRTIVNSVTSQSITNGSQSELDRAVSSISEELGDNIFQTDEASDC